MDDDPLDLWVREERHDLDMVDCIHARKFGGYESLLVEGSLRDMVVVPDVRHTPRTG